MFEQSILDGGKTNKSWTVLGSFVLQLAAVGVLVIIPLLAYEQLPKTSLTSFLVAPPPPPPPPPPPAAVVMKAVKIIPRQFDANKLMAPKAIPKQVAMIKEEELPPPGYNGGGVVGGVPGGMVGGSPGGVIGGIISSVPSAPPPPAPKPVEKKVERIRVGGNVIAANLIRKVQPQYPPLAKNARIQGTVRFTAIIAKDGSISNLQLVSGHPLLVPAAQEAVKQWQYRPTLLNGEPVEVITQIDVNFTLSN
jgi:protein TonB